MSSRCQSCDDSAHMQICRRSRKPLQYQCHAGLTEYLAPLYYEGVIVAFIVLSARQHNGTGCGI
ncbi:MAG: PocR ligand-binding domain-containing protein [Acutalibacteraceae bacterium]